MTDFFDSEAGQHAMVAKQYLEAALTLVEAQPAKGRVLFRPTLALAGHGLELMLKACFHLNNQVPPKSGRQGHDIVGMWHAAVCEPVRGHVAYNAELVAEVERAKGFYPDVPSHAEIPTLIVEYVLELGRLHGSGDYPLRYPTDPSKHAPRTPFLVTSLWRTADDFVKRPNDFEVMLFRTLFSKA
ncbi:MAG: hypothetical protein Q7J44_16900 [Pseudotabrizicola sp.]|uniref:hypothetical protein n=1 Tax=Pseudotabrizicola sp. TaxID=2939647 RepID=UPI002716730E|nr:hypothetical protein [Pseudotabrizicola sp.]MDO9640218.1 hypothetical protein [Pseudotabrizicola sp.]